MAVVVVLLVAAAVLAIAYALLTRVNERSAARGSLRRLEGYEVQGARDRTLLQPLGERAIKPAVKGMAGFVRRFSPVGYYEHVERQIVLAGSPRGLDADQVLAFNLLGAASALLWILLVIVGLGANRPLGWAFVALLTASALLLPNMMLTNRVERRKRAIRRSLPDMLDLLTISVEAGLGLEQAIDRTVEAVPGPLADEFRRMLQEVRIGSTRSQALRAMEERTDVRELRAFILAMLQADTFGVSIARILRNQADEMRVRRRVGAQETAQKAPVKMLAPLITCIFPAIFVVVLVPALIQVAKTLR